MIFLFSFVILLSILQGLAYVDFSDDAHLAAAVAKNKKTLMGKRLSIARSDPKQRRMRESSGRHAPERDHGILVFLCFPFLGRGHLGLQSSGVLPSNLN